MRRLFLSATLGLFLINGLFAADNKGYEALFDGKTLQGWTAMPADSAASWSVKDGAIAGIGIQKRQVFLVYDDHTIGDFELKFSYRLHGEGNTGVNIRSRTDTTGKRLFEAYHADIGHPGIGSHILGAWDFHFGERQEYPCRRGTRLIIHPDGGIDQESISNALSLKDVKADEWNHVRILALGNHFKFYINGKLSSVFTDNFPNFFSEGSIGLQIHDPGVKVEFKDIFLKRL